MTCSFDGCGFVHHGCMFFFRPIRSCLSPSCGCVFFCNLWTLVRRTFQHHITSQNCQQSVDDRFSCCCRSIRTVPTHHSITWFLLMLTVTTQLCSHRFSWKMSPCARIIPISNSAIENVVVVFGVVHFKCDT